MLAKLDKIFWVVSWVGAFISWMAVEFFGWHPDPKFVTLTAFLALQFSCSTKLDLFKKQDKN